MKFSRLRRAENPNNPMSDSLNLSEDDWMYRVVEEESHPSNNPQENSGIIDPSAQPYAMNPGNQVQFMAGSNDSAYDFVNHLQNHIDSWLNQYSYLGDNKELEKQMNPIGDLDNLTMYEMSTCLGGNPEERYNEEDPLYTGDDSFYEDDFTIQLDNDVQFKRNPTDPLLMFASDDEEIEEDNNNLKSSPKDLLFPGYTYPLEGYESGVPFAEQAPLNSYPGLF